MHEEKEIKDKILRKAEEMFYQYGYTRVTMDEIATDLSISKKTLYKFFPSKELLLKEMVFCMKCEVTDFVDQLWADKETDFVEKLKKLMNFLGKQNSKLRGPLLTDLQKHIPDIWQEIQDFRNKHALNKFSELLKEGVERGVFRKDISQQLIVLTYVNSIRMINPDVLSQLPYTANQFFEAVIKVIFEGILTEDARKKYLSISGEMTPEIPVTPVLNSMENNNYQ
jgi:AcrR family transcriptional regulator